MHGCSEPGSGLLLRELDRRGRRVKSRKPSYTFTMPASDLTLTANYAKAVFYDGFEGMKVQPAGPLRRPSASST